MVLEFLKAAEVQLSSLAKEAFKEIKPHDITLKEVQHFWDKMGLEEGISAKTDPMGIPREIITNGIDRRFDEGIGNKMETSKICQEIRNEYNDKCENFKITCPENNGKWTGEKMHSTWVPDDNYKPQNFNPDNKPWKEIKKEYGWEEIPFDNYPDFSKVSKGEVKIDNFVKNRVNNFIQANEKLAEQRGCSPEDVEKWMKENKYSWHECSDCQTLQQVPQIIHGNIRHTGGHSIMSNFG